MHQLSKQDNNGNPDRNGCEFLFDLEAIVSPHAFLLDHANEINTTLLPYFKANNPMFSFNAFSSSGCVCVSIQTLCIQVRWVGRFHVSIIFFNYWS